MPGLYGELRRAADRIWARILEHPFVVELFSGTLPLEKFRFYVLQDYNFLLAMMRVFSLLAAKSVEHAGLFAELARVEATVELENYRRLLRRLGLSLEDAARVEPAPTNVGYTSFLLATCSLEDAATCLASILPCFASYMEIAERYRDRISSNPVDVYREWASAYISDEYVRLVNELIRVFEELAVREHVGKYRRVFLTASRYEYAFWEMAYRGEAWPV